MIIARVTRFLKSLLLKEPSSHKLALSFSMGVYIAFSPFIGFHTIMVFIFAWLFRLNWAVVFAGSCLVNNPWTMIPIYTLDYVFGVWLFQGWLQCDLAATNPSWMCWINGQLVHYLGLPNVSLWAFIIGGNLLGILVSVMLYPMLRFLLLHLMHEKRN